MTVLEKYKEEIIKYWNYDGHPPYFDKMSESQLDEMQQLILSGEFAEVFKDYFFH